MGLKLSCIHRGSSRLSRQPSSPAPARVIAADGSLKELPASSPTRISHVIGLGHKHNGDAAPPFFVSNSNALYFNEHPPALAPGDLLRSGQIYFVLPAAMLEKPLSTADMAVLAVRANMALALAALSSGKPRRRARGSGKKKAVRVMLVREEMEDGSGGEDVFFNEKLNQQTLGEFGASLMLSATKKHKKLAPAAAAARLKRALSIIQEDAE